MPIPEFCEVFHALPASPERVIECIAEPIFEDQNQERVFIYLLDNAQTSVQSRGVPTTGAPGAGAPPVTKCTFTSEVFMSVHCPQFIQLF